MTMKDQQVDNNIRENASKAFDQQVDTLDSQTLHRLREAREHALSQKDKKFWFSKKWITGAGLALASILTFVMVPQLTASKLSPLEDLEMLSAETDMDLYTQLDFYQWLDETLDES